MGLDWRRFLAVAEPRGGFVQRVACAVAFLALAGCSLILDVGSVEGRPCKEGQCLDGYLCRNEVCVAKPAPDDTRDISKPMPRGIIC